MTAPDPTPPASPANSASAPDSAAPGTFVPLDAWPALRLADWAETYSTLHMMTQVVGKIRLARMPPINHSWHVPFYLTSRGLTTAPMPHGARAFQIDFDFLDHTLRITASDGDDRLIALQGCTVARFYAEVMDALTSLRLPVKIWPHPVEVPDPIPFDADTRHSVYAPEHAHRFWLVLWQADRVLTEFRSRFVGKCSPVHFFWGSFDLAVTRFSGRRAPPHPGGIPNLPDRVAREAYSRECASSGFWPGGGAVPEAAFYAYAYPEPAGYREYPGLPAGAFYSDEMREYILPYEVVRRSGDPDALLHDFFQVTYEAGAELGGWNRPELEQEWSAGAGPARTGALPPRP